MKLFNWFKKKVSLVSTPPTTNINGIYSARLEDLDTIRNSLGSLQTQLQELSNRLDSLPPIPDLTQYARKDQTNTFTQKNTFNRGIYMNNQKIEGLLAPTGNGDATHKLYVDTSATNTLNSARSYSDTKKSEAVQESNTHTNNVMNALNSQLENFARKDQQNAWEAQQNFRMGVSMETGTIDRVMSDNKAIVNKEYVDNKSAKLIVDKPTAGNYSNCYVWKQTLSTGGFAYFVNDTRGYTVPTPGVYLVVLRIKKIQNGSQYIETRGSYTQIVSTPTYSLDIKFEFQVATWVDLLSGNNGRFIGSVDYDISTVFLKPN